MATVPNIIANLTAGDQPASLLDQNWAACAVLANNLDDIPNPSTALTNLGGLAATTPAPWTPTDASGAALSFSAVSGAFQTIGNLVHAYFSLTFPVTANGTATLIGGLPVLAANNNYANTVGPIQNSVGLGMTFGVLVKNTLTFQLWTSGHLINSQFSAATISGILIYPAT